MVASCISSHAATACAPRFEGLNLEPISVTSMRHTIQALSETPLDRLYAVYIFN